MKPNLQWALAAALLAATQAASANCDDSGACTFIVENTADLVDTNPGDGLCRAAIVVPLSYACTLRAAVMEANARELLGEAVNGPYEIVLEGGHTYQMKIAPGSGTSAAHGDLDVRASDVTIRTAEDDGQRAIIAAGDGYAGSALRIGKQVGNVQASGFSLAGVEIRGFAPSDAETGVVDCELGSNVLLKNVRIEENTLVDTSGAPLLVRSGCSMTVVDSVLAGNSNTGTGSENGRGGAIRTRSFGDLVVRRSAIVGNTATRGASIYMEGDSAAVLENVVVAGNSMAVNAGATLQVHDTAALTLHNVTISRNGRYGIYAAGAAPVVIMANSVISDNGTSASMRLEGANGSAGLVSLGNNRVDGFDPLGYMPPSFSSNGDQSGLHDPSFAQDLVPIGAYGIPALVPLPGSPLLDQGSDGLIGDSCIDEDISGLARKAGGRCDIGAVERFPEAWVFHAVQHEDASDAEPGDGTCSADGNGPQSCTLRAAFEEISVLADGGHVGPFEILLAAGVHSITEDAPLSAYNNEVTIQPHPSLAVGQRPRVRNDRGDVAALFDVGFGSQGKASATSPPSLTVRNVDVSTMGGIADAGRLFHCLHAGLRLELVRIDAHQGLAAIHSSHCDLRIEDSQVSGLISAGESTDPIVLTANTSTVTIERSEISNITDTPSGSGSGQRAKGGVEGRLVLSLSETDAVLRNTTISGNEVGAPIIVAVSNNARTLKLHSVTLFDNTTFDPTYPGGLYADGFTDAMLTGSIIAGTIGAPDYCIATNPASASRGYNILGQASDGCAISTVATDTVTNVPGLTGLQTLGSHTIVRGHVPVAGGAARDHGSTTFSHLPEDGLCAPVDQASRPRDVANNICDIGAVEYFAAPPPPVNPDAIFADGFDN